MKNNTEIVKFKPELNAQQNYFKAEGKDTFVPTETNSSPLLRDPLLVWAPRLW